MQVKIGLLSLATLSLMALNVSSIDAARTASYYTTVPSVGKITNKTKIYSYAKAKFKSTERKVTYNPGSVISVVGVDNTTGTPRLVTSTHTYITANKANVLAVNKNISNYISAVPTSAMAGTLKKTRAYADADLKVVKQTLPVGTTIHISSISWSNGGTPRLYTTDGYYISANKSIVVAANKNIENYYTLINSTGIINTLTNVGAYNDSNFTSRVKSYSKKTALKIIGMGWSNGGTPRFKLSNGTYITTNRNNVFGDDTLTSNFINKYADTVRKVSKKYGIYGSIQLAQAALESSWGQSSLTTSALNFFGVKGDYNGASVTVPTKENENGKWITIIAAFRKYPNATASFTDNAKLLVNGPGFNVNYYAGTWRKNAATYVAAANALTGTYATDPNYAAKIIQIIKTYNLHALVD